MEGRGAESDPGRARVRRGRAARDGPRDAGHGDRARRAVLRAGALRALGGDPRAAGAARASSPTSPAPGVTRAASRSSPRAPRRGRGGARRDPAALRRRAGRADARRLLQDGTILDLAANVLAGEIAARTGQTDGRSGTCSPPWRSRTATGSPSRRPGTSRSGSRSARPCSRAAGRRGRGRVPRRPQAEPRQRMVALRARPEPRAQGKTADAAAVEARFQKAWARADVTLASSRFMSRGMPNDRYGLALTTSSAAAAAYVDAVDRLLAAREGALEGFDRALAADPGFALAGIGRSRSLLVGGRGPEGRAADVRGARPRRRARTAGAPARRGAGRRRERAGRPRARPSSASTWASSRGTWWPSPRPTASTASSASAVGRSATRRCWRCSTGSPRPTGRTGGSWARTASRGRRCSAGRRAPR